MEPNATVWCITNDEVNFRPVTSDGEKRDMIKLRSHLAGTAVKFKHLVRYLKPYFYGLTDPGKERRWGSDNILVTFSRNEEEYFIEVFQPGELEAKAKFVLYFEKPDIWEQPVQIEPFSAYGQVPDIVTLADIFLEEWPNCRKLA